MTDDRQRTREAFRRADAGHEPSIERLVAAVPDLIGEARRRRAAAESDRDFFTLLVPLAWRAIPGLATAAAVLMIASAAMFLAGGSSTSTSTSTTVATTTTATATTDGTYDLESLILTGRAAGQDDPLLRAITTDEGS